MDRYRDAILAYQKAEFISNASLVLLGTVQNIIINLGFAAGAFLCAWYVSMWVIKQTQSHVNFFFTLNLDSRNSFDMLSQSLTIKVRG